MTKQTINMQEEHPKTLLIGVYAPYNKIKNIQSYYDEFLSLVKTLGLKYDDTLFVKLRSVDKANFFTKGKLQELIDFCEKNQFEQIVLSEILSPLQERNIGDHLNCHVFDREKLILEIFRNAAHTAEGKIQVEMAEIEFLKTRLAGKGIELAQQEGIVGSKGPGETSKELLKRHLHEKTRQAKKRLETLQYSRETQRKKRLQSQLPLICLVGYTNTGKSSLINQIAKSDVLVEDKLFATLDTTTRELFLANNKKVLISDTVGFINQLPHHLIEAFKSTLDELKYADLLLLVVDLNNPAWEDQINIVQKTLDELTVHKDILYVFNKIDLIDQQNLEELQPRLKNYQPHVLIHTKDKQGVEPLLISLKNYDFKKE